ncbi:MAG TPA: stalk domain-containing protein, partial [Candidatus Elarobacter sp.]
MSLARLAFALTFIAAVAAPAAAAETSIPLTRVAAENGYTYAWLAGEGAVSLSRPGVVVVLRAGQKLYRIGDRVISADRAPYYDGTDLVVSPAVAANLRRLAQAYPVPPPPLAPPTQTAAVTGALSVEARQVAGRDAIAVSGRGPADAPVYVTLTGEISRDLPVVVLSRTATRIKPDGSYEADIGITSAPPRETVVIATVTSVTGV